MILPGNFIAAGTDYSTLTDFVPAPYFRKSFRLETVPDDAKLVICGIGFYDLFINGEKITKGFLAPYISNPDDILYYDEYGIADLLSSGENVIGICLGNGLQNNPGGWVWDFDQALYRGAPQVAMELTMNFENEIITIVSDDSFKIHDSPIYFDDLRAGEYYDARMSTPKWNCPGFDDNKWEQAIKAPCPRGERKLCHAEPIVVTNEMLPTAITQVDGGYLYDFGVNTSGVCRLTISGEPGQVITLYHGEHLEDGKLNRANLFFVENDYIQKDIYICNGEGLEVYTPSFTFHGFQYVYATGLLPNQALPETLTYLEMSSDLKELGGFECSNTTVNALQRLTRRSTLSNFFYFPMDCPHREKNGWTADAALSAEHTLLNLSAEKSYREWLCNIRKAQRDDGALPGIVPTAGWGYEWGNGPAWDCVIVWLPYYIYLYRGDKDILFENAHAIFRYLQYLSTKIQENGLLEFGLGDWCSAGRVVSDYKSPLYFTDTVMGIDICEKAAYIFDVLGMNEHRDFARAIYKRLRLAAREKLIDTSAMIAEGACQTSQAMAIFFNIFDDAEKPEAFRVLLRILKQHDEHMDVGVLGGRVLFHVLAEFGEIDLALKMIIQPTFPSYGWWVEQGATTLWEVFLENRTRSLNHHFWGDISHFFIRHIAGIHYNPCRDGQSVNIRPNFPEDLQFASGFHICPKGEISVCWERKGTEITLKASVPNELKGRIKVPYGYTFEGEMTVKDLQTGVYTIRTPKSGRLTKADRIAWYESKERKWSKLKD